MIRASHAWLAAGALWLMAVASARSSAAQAPAVKEPTSQPSLQAPASQRMKQSVGRWVFPLHRVKVEEHEGPYLEYTPPDWDGKAPLPMLIFLHGSGYKGNDARLVFDDEVPLLIRAGRVFPAIVLCPQVNSYWEPEQVATFIDLAMKTYAGRFDPDRVYLTGESSGGGGVWGGANLRTSVLAAAVPAAPMKGIAKAENLVKLPIWVFHNANDPYAPAENSRNWVKAIRDAGGKYVRYTEYTQTVGRLHEGIYPDCHAQAWKAAYSDEELWGWLFRQQRGKPELALDGSESAMTAPATRASH